MGTLIDPHSIAKRNINFIQIHAPDRDVWLMALELVYTDSELKQRKALKSKYLQISFFYNSMKNI